MKTPLLIDMFDFYGKEIPLQIFGNAKKKSLFGAIMGVLSLLSVGAISIYFLSTLFSRDTKQIVTNQSTTLLPQNDLSNIPFIISLVDAMAIPVPLDAGIYEAYAAFYRGNWSNGSYSGAEYTVLETRPCKREDVAGFPAPDSVLAWNWCIPYGKYNLTLNSANSDFINGWTAMFFILTKCNPQKNKNCQNETVINKWMEGGYFTVTTAAYVVDNDDNTNPMKLTVNPQQMTTSASLFKKKSFYYAQNLFTDDIGFVFEFLVIHNFFTVGEGTTTEYSLTAPTSMSHLGGSTPVAVIALYNSPNVVTTKRTLLKAQAILANIGGVMKFIMVIAQVITHIVTRKDVFVLIGNEVFDYKESKPRKEKEMSENRILRIEGRTVNAVPIFVKTLGEKKIPSIKQNPTNDRRESLKLTLCQLICITGCVRNKKVMSQYDLTERIILEKVSVHSLIQDSYKLDNLSILTLNADQYKKLNESTHMPLEIEFEDILN